MNHLIGQHLGPYRILEQIGIGGMATIWGSVLGAGILTILPQVLVFLEDYDILVYGLILIMTVLFMPEGVARGGQKLAGRLRGRIAGPGSS